MSTYSFHTFMFPFRWKIKDLDNRPFSEQIDLNNIRYAQSPNWERLTVPTVDKESDDLYNERNYFYEFVHAALYDDNSEHTIIRHFERREPKNGDVTYHIVCGEDRKEYVLDVNAINLNLYSTGVGVLSLFMHNDSYPDAEDVLFINQYGRRVFPPFINDVNIRTEIAYSIGFEGLNGIYAEDFSSYTNKVVSNTPAAFITKMVHEVAENIVMQPVIDDRMFVLSWYKNDQMAEHFKRNNDGYKEFLHSDWWYKYVFVDGGSKTCPNDDLSHRLIDSATYPRWQQWGTLYGVSRYSMVMLTSTGCPDFLTTYFETEYARMAELAFMQRATVLRFSSEITKISNMSLEKGFGTRVSSLYKEYIRFENQIYFREVSAQDQGIEMYKLLFDAVNLKEQVEKLDDEIEELYNFVSLREDRLTNRTMSLLTWITTIFLPVTVVAGFFSMNDEHNNIAFQSIVMVCFAIVVITTVLIINKKKIR
jgi:hypothetical protein